MIQNKNRRFQIVLANLQMKGMRRLSFLQILVKNHISVVAIVRKRSKNYFEKIVQKGAKYCMAKPNNWPDLKNVWRYGSSKRRRSIAAIELGPSGKKHKRSAAAIIVEPPQSKDKGNEDKGKGKEVVKESQDKGEEVVIEPRDKGKVKEVLRTPEGKGNEEFVKAPAGKGKHIAREPEVQVTVIDDNVVEWIAKPFKEEKGSGNIYDHTKYYYKIKAKYPLTKKTNNSLAVESILKSFTITETSSTSSGFDSGASIYVQGEATNFRRTFTSSSYQGQNANYSIFPNQQIQVGSPTFFGHGGQELGVIRPFSDNPSGPNLGHLPDANPYAMNLLHELAPATFNGLISDPSLNWARKKSTTSPIVSLANTIYQNKSLMGTSSLNQPATLPSSLTWTSLPLNLSLNNDHSNTLKFNDPVVALFEQDLRQHKGANMWNTFEEQFSLPQGTISPPQLTNLNQKSYSPVAAEISPPDVDDQNEILSDLVQEPITPKDNSTFDYFVGLNMEEYNTPWDYLINDIDQVNQMDAHLSTIPENGSLGLNSVPGEVDQDVTNWSSL